MSLFTKYIYTHIIMNKIAILAADGFKEIELKSPKIYLQNKGFQVDIVSPKDIEFVRSWNHFDWGPSYPIDVHLAEADPAVYEALILPGGTLSPDALRVLPKALDFIKHFIEQKKLIAAICHGAWPLVELDYVKGKRMTSVSNIRSDLKNAGAIWEDEAVIQDGNLISSRTPDDLEFFNSAVTAYLEEVTL
ncbi:type 1 glutamine amidotransferase domain-containing protein [Sphingobacterium spiritivorum]|uniref:Intracellular protease, PfpI family n=2 Tax=Sphingobacterium spiritivorum TaxID=258 RepID=D7VIE9_SPHSI|nr:type 1 glutamine amidotransferase domain-containing protein [Sphingobacterium spiritivorum]EFK59851.1 intracellular protease, PfpI family [Sphingobacterium spiritivorum ATCC 33861]SUI97130.1 intracellular protease, PfpI family [Sphingobacterium spiritivorum]